jgi:hypothetical protein
MDETLISRIRKNAAEEIWIALTEYHGHELLSIRVYFRGIDGFQPTRKGVAVGVSSLAELRDALNSTMESDESAGPVIIGKNTSEEIRVFRSDYMGHLLMNIRVFFRRGKGAEMEPSHKGIAFNVHLTAEVVRGVNLAVKHAAGQIKK